MWMRATDQVEMERSAGTLIAITFLSSLLGMLLVAFTEALREYHSCFVGEMVHSLIRGARLSHEKRESLAPRDYMVQGLVN